MELTTERYTHYISLKDGRQIFLTEKQVYALELDISSKKTTDRIKISDAFSKEEKYNGPIGKLDEIFKIKISDHNSGDGYRCDYGVHHKFNTPYGTCDCAKYVGGVDKHKFWLNMKQLGIILIQGLVNGDRPLNKSEIQLYRNTYLNDKS